MSKITVVCPTFNSALFVGNTLAVLFAQTRQPDRVIFSDDGSTDDTVAVLRNCIETMAGNVPCTVLANHHLGPGAARNAGIKAADSEWIAFLDSDDLWMPEKLARIEVAIQKHPEANFFCHDEMRITVDGRSTPLVYGTRYRAGCPLPPQLYFSNMFSTSAVVCRRELLVKQGYFDETLMSAQDYELWLRLSPFIRPVFIRETLGKYVERTGNITSNNLTRRLTNEVRIALMHRHKVSIRWVGVRLVRILISYSLQYARTKFGACLRRQY